MKRRLKGLGRGLRRASKSGFDAARTDGLMLLGVGVLAYGAWMIYEPVGVIVAGVSLIGLGWIQGASS